MSEQPSSKPINDLTWATSGGATKSEATPAEKAAGWVFQDSPPFDENNWRRNAAGQDSVWLRGVAVRRMTRLDGPNGPLGPAAVDSVEVEVGDRFTYEPVRAANILGDAVQKGSLAQTGAMSTVLAMTTDHLNLWYWWSDGSSLHLEARDLDDPTADGVQAYIISTHDDAPIAMDCDGWIVATGMDASSTGHNLTVHRTGAGGGTIGQVFAGDVGGVGSEIFSVCADSTGSELDRVWCVLWQGGSGSELRQWSNQTGASAALVTTAGEAMWDVCASPDAVFWIQGNTTASDNILIRAYPKDPAGDLNATGATRGVVTLYESANVTGGKGANRGARICTDGVRIYCVLSARVGSAGADRGEVFAIKADVQAHDPAAVGPAATNATPLWSVTDALAGEELGATWYLQTRIHCDDRFVYVACGEVMLWLDKTDGSVIRREQVVGDDWSYAQCVSGERLHRGGLENSVGAGTPAFFSGINSYDISRPPGDYVQVNVDPDDGVATFGYSDPQSRRTRKGYHLFSEGRP